MSQLRSRLENIGRELSTREAAHGPSLEDARKCAEKLHGIVSDALDGFHQSIQAGGIPQLQMEISAPRVDEKHLRSIQFDVWRGRHKGIITVKSRGEVTLVGPFRTGKNEGPCRSFPWDQDEALQEALGDFLESLIEAAATP